MRRLQLPKNKLARLAINIAFVLWWLFAVFIIFWVWVRIIVFYNAIFSPPLPYVYAIPGKSFSPAKVFEFITIYLPMILATSYIWRGSPKSLKNIFLNKRIWGRLKPRPRITRSKED